MGGEVYATGLGPDEKKAKPARDARKPPGDAPDRNIVWTLI